MKMYVVFFIEDQNPQKVSVEAYSADAANIYIYASSLQEATELLPKGEKLAKQAMQDWIPDDIEADPEEEIQEEHYRTYQISEERMKAAASDYENTPKGINFVKRLQNAREFYFKHSKRFPSFSEIVYLANKHSGNLINGSMDLIALSYKRGYMAGKKAASK